MRPHARFIFSFIVTVTAITLLAAPSFAESRSKPSAESHYKKGMTAYSLGHFPEAIEEFEKAYEIKEEPVFLYNIAQSQRQNKDPQRAIFFYRRFLEADPETKNRAEVEKRIKDLDAQISAQQVSAQKEAEAQKEQPLTPPTTGPAVAPAPVVKTDPAAPPPPVAIHEAPPQSGDSSHAGKGLRITGIVAGSVGVAAIVAGVVSGLHANTLYNQARPAASQGVYDAAKDDSSKTYRKLEWVGIGVGAAALATGTVLYIVGSSAKNSAENSEGSVALLPLLGPGTGGAALSGRF